ncbi:HD-GYP domain-containing protein [Desulfitibacter alkalitolerans]|uniref:HD-GYP domain-containing protein n=1 Tax=Desulfitibacter alkalitolerans TaxID=264641 RepID=UPI00068612F4|nr:HD domain-containing phosphohydrolase [Desulfitibacter alkalitolerans]
MVTILQAAFEQQEIEQLRRQITLLNNKLQEQSFLVKMTNILIKGHDLETTIKSILQLAMDITGSEAGCLYIADQNISQLKIVEVNGEISDALVEALSRLSQLLTNEELHKIVEITQDNSLFEYFAKFDNKLISLINVPLLTADNNVIGYAVVMHRHEAVHNHPNIYSSKDLKHLTLFAHQAALLLDNTRLKIEQGKKETYIKTIASLVSAIDEKDIYTQNHSQRVAKITVEFSKAMGLLDDIVEKLHYGALLHDIGKIGVPDSILNKPTSLNNGEFDVVKEHPVKGVRILAPMELDSIVLDIIKYHHERFDGRGYPNGLKGEKIPLAARIVSIVDAWDAMNSDRAYRSRLSQEQILTELEKGKGTQFDPFLAGEFIILLTKNFFN